MHNYLKIIMFFGLLLISCASSSKSALSKQENFINSHPNWRGHDFNFKGKKLNTDIFKVMEAIQHEQKIQFVQDSVCLRMKDKINSALMPPKFLSNNNEKII